MDILRRKAPEASCVIKNRRLINLTSGL